MDVSTPIVLSDSGCYNTPSDNYDEMRGRSLSTNEYISRDSLMSFMKSFVAYHDRMEHNNAIDVNNKIVDTSPALFYETD